MRFVALFILSILLFSCSGKNVTSIPTIDLLSPEMTEMKSISGIATDVHYIPLETTPKAFMRFIQDIKLVDDKFYIYTATEVLCFDRTGKFLYKLSKQGRGPDEYTNINDYDIDPVTHQLMILTTGKINYYDEIDTGFILSKTMNLKNRATYADFIPGQNRILLSYTAADGTKPYQCLLFEPGGDTLVIRTNHYRFTKNTKVVMGFRYDNIVFSNNNHLRFKGFLSDTIFMINKDNKISPYMILKTSGKNMTTEFLANIPISELTASASASTGFIQINNVSETDRYLFYRYSYQKTLSWGVYDKKADESQTFDGKTLLKDDISGGINIEPKFVWNNVIYSWTDALTLKKHISGDDFRKSEVINPERKNEIERLAGILKEDDNHLLIVITPRR